MSSRALPADPPGVDYEASKELARHADPKVRRQLAGRADLRPEILYFLAADAEPEVRREIARNDRTPRQADLLLARDKAQAVRLDLARKIARLAPTLNSEQREQVREATIEVIEVLARDQAARIRQTIAESLKDLAQAPAHIIGELARDAVLAVSAPVLQFSPLLSDEDLVEIIASQPVQGALTAIARRAHVGMRVSDALVATALDDDGAVPTVTALLDNPSAQIREETLERILDAAPRNQAWHRPLVRRPLLPLGAIRRLAGFVAQSLLDQLMDRPDLDPESAKAVVEAVKRRLEADGKEPGAPGTSGTDRPLDQAIAAGDRRAAVRGLAKAAALSEMHVEKILDSRSAKGVMALAWKAKLPVRLAVQLQQRIGGIAPRSVLNPRAGTEYPMKEEEMNWQLEFFTGLG
jgi:uncharacterized protein (DUF2336 family)